MALCSLAGAGMGSLNATAPFSAGDASQDNRERRYVNHRQFSHPWGSLTKPTNQGESQ